MTTRSSRVLPIGLTSLLLACAGATARRVSAAISSGCSNEVTPGAEDVVRRTFQPALTRCYRAALQRNERLWGRLQIVMRVASDGTVQEVGQGTVEGTLPDDLVTCLVAVAWTPTFASTGHPGQCVATSFNFVSSHVDPADQ